MKLTSSISRGAVRGREWKMQIGTSWATVLLVWFGVIAQCCTAFLPQYSIALGRNQRRAVLPSAMTCKRKSVPIFRQMVCSSESDDAGSLPSQEAKSANSGPKVVIVGGGWAGFGAARHLSKQGYQVVRYGCRVSTRRVCPDGRVFCRNPGGTAAGIKTKKGRIVEAGIKGFWYQYNNIFQLLRELGASNALTDWTSYITAVMAGAQVDAPVLQRELKLPSPLGQFVHTLPTFTSLSVADRLSLWQLFYPLVNYNIDYDKYDSMSIAELMRSSGVSDRLYNDFLRPLLLAMLFAPPEELSASVIIGSFEFLALGHQSNFDVRWCRGSISERIFSPLLQEIADAGGVIQGSRFVSDLKLTDGKVSGVIAVSPDGKEYSYDADAVVLSVGINGFKKLVSNIPALAARQEFQRVMNLRSSDCIATRIWFDKRLSTRSPSNVLTLPGEDVGATFFNLNDLHDEYRDRAHVSVIAADLYHAASLLPLTDEQILEKVLSLIRSAEPAFRTAKVEDFAVIRAPQCATLFHPGSYRNRPKQVTSVPNLFLAGDWVREEPMHGADGLSQERALVTGLMASNLVVSRLKHGKPCNILPVEADEPHIAAARQANAVLKQSASVLGIPLPF